MPESIHIDLSDAPVVDAHCHGFSAETLAASDAAHWLDRVTLMGMCFGSSAQVDKRLAGYLPEMTQSTLLAKAARRWLAEALGCGQSDLDQVRAKNIAQNAGKYASDLLAQENLTGLFIDEGYPQPGIPLADIQDTAGATVYRVARIEPLIEKAKKQTRGFEDFLGRYRELLEQAAEEPNTLAFKSIIAYRTGLDIEEPDRDHVEGSFQAWKESGWQENREVSKPVRDHLLNIALDLAHEREMPFHIHTGGGDPDVLLRYANPALLERLIKNRMGQPLVLIHAGYPWLGETAYLASIYPLVYVDISVVSPWTVLHLDSALEFFLGSFPTQKLFHGSDAVAEPEIIWLAARLTRRALQRVLGRAVEQDLIDQDEAQHIGRCVLAKNVLKLHGK